MEKFKDFLEKYARYYVSAGSDTQSLRTSGKHVPLPEARSKKESDGEYAGNTIPIGTKE